MAPAADADAVGWQSRDWAKFTDEERRAIYGAHPPAPLPGTRTVTPRATIWAVLASLVLTVLGFGWTQRESGSLQGPGITPSALYGTEIPAGSSLGPPGVCRELEYTSGAWRCTSIAVNLAGVPVIGATPYNGACAHLRVDGTAWVCLDATAPAPAAPSGTNS